MPDAIKARRQSILWARSIIERPNTLITDLETTGLNKQGNDEPVEISVIDLHGSVLFDQRLLPTVRIDLGAQLVHGISMEMLEGMPTFKQRYTELDAILSGKLVLIFNRNYDTGILESAAHNQGVAPISFHSDCVMLRMAAFIGDWNFAKGGWRWPSLEKACAHFNLKPIEPAHSALSDCRSTLAVLQAMAKEDF